MVLVVLRLANSGCSATSVVPEISFSWRATSTPSLGRDQVGFDEVGALADREAIGLERVLGAITAGAAMGDHDQALGVAGAVVGRGGFRRNGLLRAGGRTRDQCKRTQHGAQYGGTQGHGVVLCLER